MPPIPSFLRGLLAASLLAPLLTAQTWIGGTSTNWDDAANWDTGTVPDGPAATATFSATGLDPQYNTDISMSADWTLGGIVFAPDARPVTLYAGVEGQSSEFALVGTGLQNNSAVQQRVWLTAPSFDHTYGISLTFREQAAIAGDVRLIAIGENRHINFHEQSSAGSATIASYNTDFHDQSTAANATFDQTMAAAVTFHDQSTAASATLPGYYGSVTFADSSSAGSAKIKRPEPVGSSSQVFFRDHSTAGSSELYVYNVEFSGQATAAQARLNNAGGQVYSSHGAYSTQFATATFRDWSRAGDAVIDVNSLASLTFIDDSSAERATITNVGRVTFADRSLFANARLLAGSGTYYGYGGYNEAAPLITVGDVVFKDQATGGNGSVEITSAAAKLDFSGLFSGTGTTGRAVLPTDASPSAIIPDDPRGFALGAIHNTVPGGTIYLGGTNLYLGSTDQNMTLSALIRDTGGAYGSAAGEPLRGGGLNKVGAGTLTIANPDNDYTGSTTILDGTLNLAGGRINNAYLFGDSRLTGTGVVRGGLNNSAVVSPGNSAGTINVTGDYFQNPVATLQIELVSADAYDRLIIGGNAALAGTLQLSLPTGAVPVGSMNFAFLTAGSITGTFDTVTQGPGFGAALSSQLVYGATGVSLQITQHPFAGFGSGSPAAAALGAHFDATLAGSTGDYRALIAGLNTLPSDAAIATALEALAPDRYSTLAENSFLSAAVQQAAQDRRFAAWRADPAARGFGVFFEGGQHRAEFDAAPGLAAAESTLAGGTGGVAWTGSGFTLGAGVTQESGDADLDGLGSRADLESTAPAVFFQYAGKHFFLSAAAAFSQDDYDLRRRIVYPGNDLTATAQTSGTRNDFAVTLGRSFRAGTWAITPQAGVLASRWQLDSFTETGAAGASLTLPDQSLRSLRTRVGVDFAAQNPRFSPRLSVAWLHETEEDRSIEAAFSGGGTYVAPGRPTARDLVQASLGFDWRVGRKGAFYATLAGAWGDGARVTSDISAGFRWQF
jgi:autotransporter-associated beta strand protein